MFSQNKNLRGCKKPNSQTLQGATAQALAVGNIHTGRITCANYHTAAQKNKQGVTSC
ncbi:hypothetical protein Xedl_03722 [Xenorhabdus eapokensis]|uniref:Uncharacterized protein n=1 Tax=Xenorhabdus eapokensis TaxID=1873482 RepID=A0A1Q5TGQ7_9GAMM|nr:hypothetical protein Xedl_03722 [Xenorhabdus eapokensis]